MEKDRKKKIIALLLIAVISTLSVAFAAVSRTININGTAKMDTATWDVHFENLSDARIIRDAQEVNKPYISDDGIMIYDMDVKLTKPKDEIIYTVEIVNSGTIDAEIESIEVPTLTEEQEKLIDFTAVYNDGTSITQKDFLKAGEEDLITISIKYSNDITEFDLPDEALTINLTFKINYIQSDSLTNENNGKTEVVSVLAKGNSGAATSTFYNGTISKESVESIDFLSTMYVPNDSLGSWDASQSRNKSVIAWYQDVDKNGLYELYIGGNGKVYAPSDSSYLFANFSHLKQINFNNNFDTINSINMAGMFYLSGMKSLDLSSFNTSNVTDMQQMFWWCSGLTSLNTTSFDTSKVTNMYRLYAGCTNLTSLDVSNIDTSSATTMYQMFFSCYALEYLDLSNFSNQNVTNMQNMFWDCKALKNINFGSFNTSNVTNMQSMFQNCNSLVNLDLSSFDTSKVTNMGGMFNNCSKLSNLNLSSFNTQNVTNMSYMFHGCSSLTSLDLSSFNTSNVTDMNYMFKGCSALKKLDLSMFDTSKVTQMQCMLEYCSSLSELNFSNFNPKVLGNVYGMFTMTRNIINLNISGINSSLYSNSYVHTLINSVKSGGIVYVLNEECVTLGQAIRSDVNFVVKEA